MPYIVPVVPSVANANGSFMAAEPILENPCPTPSENTVLKSSPNVAAPGPGISPEYAATASFPPWAIKLEELATLSANWILAVSVKASGPNWAANVGSVEAIFNKFGSVIPKLEGFCRRSAVAILVASVVAAWVPSASFCASAPPPNNLDPIPAVRPALNPSLTLPVTAVCARPAPIPAAAALLNPAVASPPSVLPAKRLPPNQLPNIGARNGRNASGCPVWGLTVIGIACAKPFTSAGLTCKSIESP